MKRRSALTLALAALLVVVANLLWLTQNRPSEPSPRSGDGPMAPSVATPTSPAAASPPEARKADAGPKQPIKAPRQRDAQHHPTSAPQPPGGGTNSNHALPLARRQLMNTLAAQRLRLAVLGRRKRRLQQTLAAKGPHPDRDQLRKELLQLEQGIASTQSEQQRLVELLQREGAVPQHLP